MIDVNELNEDNEIPDNEKTFFNPYREAAISKTKAKEDSDVEVEAKKDETEIELYFNFNCQLCVFKNTDRKKFLRQQKEIHSIKGKYVRNKCHRTFETKKDFNEHKHHGCGELID